MQTIRQRTSSYRVSIFYEILVWLIYVCIYKYDHCLNSPFVVVHAKTNFPYPQLIVYAIASTLYVIPFYRWLGPMLLVRQRYAWFSMITILYFIVVSALVNWGITHLFYFTNQEEGLIAFYNYESHYYRRAVSNPLLAYPDVLTDLLAFMSILLMRYAFENERKKHLLEKSNLELQLQTLKAQLQPHFLFNTLNSIYGMSLVNSVDTPAFILRLSDMMRYILYDCQQHLVPLEKDVRFLGNYLEMEKKRYPESNIVFVIEGDPGEKKIAPLLFIQFMENSFKHGAYRLGDRGFVEGALRISDKKVIFHIANDMLAVTGAGAANGGVGIENVRQRLEIHYPGRHRLMIQNDGKIFTVELTIQL